MRALKSLVVGLVAACSFAAAPARATFIDFAANVTVLTTAPTTFSFLFSTPTALSGLVSFTGTLGVDLTDTGDVGDLSIASVGGTFFEGHADSVLLGADAIGGPITTDLASAIVFSGVYDCGAGCTSIDALLHFVMTAGIGDMAVLTGRLDVVPFVATVSEPATVALFLLVLAGLAGSRVPRVRRLVRAG
jgi:hypothetical protein